MSIFVLAAKDYATKPILSITILPFILSLLTLYTLFFIGFDQLLDAFSAYQHSLKIEQEQHQFEDGSINTYHVELNGMDSILAYLLQHSVTSWLFGAFVLGIGSIITLYSSIIAATIIIGFFTPRIAHIAKARHYPHFMLQSNTTFIDVILKSLFTLLMTLFLFIILMPLYFIPFIQIIAINLPFYYLFHKLLTFDVSTTLYNKREAKLATILLGSRLKWTTLLLYISSLIPFVTLFATPYYVLALTHLYLRDASMPSRNPNVTDS